jgi:hypothetical protein
MKRKEGYRTMIGRNNRWRKGNKEGGVDKAVRRRKRKKGVFNSKKKDERRENIDKMGCSSVIKNLNVMGDIMI